MATTPHILVLYAHPTPERSRVNRLLADVAREVPGVYVDDLYETYPDFYIDVAREQALVARSEMLVFLHPIRWYSMPSLLKEWLDVVFQPGWAYARNGGQLRGKSYWLVTTTGSPVEYFQPGGMHGRPLEEFLAPFEQTAALCGMEWQPPHILQGANVADDEVINEHVAAFRRRLENYLNAYPPESETEAATTNRLDHGN